MEQVIGGYLYERLAHMTTQEEETTAGYVNVEGTFVQTGGTHSSTLYMGPTAQSPFMGRMN